MIKKQVTSFLIGCILSCSLCQTSSGFVLKAAAEQNEVLYVSGGSPVSEIDQRFLDRGIGIDVNCAYANATDIQRIILAGIETPDVFVLDVDDGYWGLVQKGYLEEISDSTMIDAVHSFYPAIQTVLMNDEHQVVAMPEYFMPVYWCVNETLWQQVFDTAPYPQTFLELAELFERWNEDFSEAYPDIKLLEFSGDSETLILNVLKQYIAQCESAGQPVVFEEEALICTLQKLRELDLQAVTEAGEDAYFNQQPLLLMQPVGGFGVEYLEGCRYVPMLPLRLEQSSPAYVPVRMRVMFVNPHSRNREAAYAYLKEYWQAQSAKVKAGMIENWTEPVFSQQGVERLKQIDEEVERTKELLFKAIEEENPDQEDLLRLQLMAWNEKRETAIEEAYDVSEEDIQAYQAIGTHVDLLFGSPYAHDENQAMQSITQIVRQFVDGKMTAEECAGKLGDIARMVEQESR